MTQRLWMVSVVAGWLWSVALAATTFCIVSMIGRIEMRRSRTGVAMITDDGPDLHAAMPDVEGVDPNDGPVRLSDYRGKEVVVLLTSLGCSSCQSLLRSIGPTKRGLEVPTEFLVVVEAPRDRVTEAVRRYRLRVPVVVDEGDAIRSALGITRSPYAFLVDSQGIVRMKGVVNDRDQLEGLIARRGRKSSEQMWHTEHGPAGETART